MADPGGNPFMAPSSLAIDFGPLQRRNKRGIPGNSKLSTLAQCSQTGPWPSTGSRRLGFRAVDRHPNFYFCIVHSVQCVNMVQILY